MNGKKLKKTTSYYEGHRKLETLLGQIGPLSPSAVFLNLKLLLLLIFILFYFIYFIFLAHFDY
jgi:hypothetical protein